MKFIVVRFPPGGGGKFLCTCLQASPDVHAWETELEKAKITNTVSPLPRPQCFRIWKFTLDRLFQIFVYAVSSSILIIG